MLRMNFFKSFRNKVSSLQKDMKKSFQEFRSKSTNDERTTEADYSDLDLYAGANILTSYQQAWADIHNSIQTSSKAAENVDRLIADLHIDFQRKYEAYHEFNKCISTLDDAIQTVNNTKKLMDGIQTSIRDIESLLSELQNIKEEEEFVAKKYQMLKELELLKHKKQLDVERDKVRLALAHSEKIKDCEAKIQASLKQRQEAMEDRYRDEIKKYKESGHVSETLLAGHLITTGSELLDIQVEDDDGEEALEAFLGVQDTDDSTAAVEANQLDEFVEANVESVTDVTVSPSINDFPLLQQYLTITNSELDSSNEYTAES